MNYPNKSTVGLVLVGGGAKGAYQVGALKYLDEIGLDPHIIAGTSIGALNGAVLASNGTFSQSVQRLDQLWTDLGEAEILRPNAGLMKPLISYGLQSTVPMFREWMLSFLYEIGILEDTKSIFNPAPIENFLRQAVKPDLLRNGTELWITAFPSLNIPYVDNDLLVAAIDFFRSRMGTKADWLCVQDCDDDDTLYNTILASAAIPLAFPKRQVNGKKYVDGALADNIPLGALAAKGCTHAIVIHLGNGTTWDRYDFPNQTIIEIRPEQSINKSDAFLIGEGSALLDFSPERISELKRRGYADAKLCMDNIIRTFTGIGDLRASTDSLINSTRLLMEDDPL
ncbi:patatin [Pseudanabaena sp. SR411]|uniref:patatin-like phospholipase family protein n=1 Tax=Pseudanabaena sp. SR411 TaxID=1980935 RepID=UPI000B9834F2|nr:patatin-like phospholipase family protein [Pseudanabaena sp. SR411]OYQ62212.1 patatin [Pseudanabaena sp. SR411]